MTTVVLASSSPRRSELLQQIGVRFEARTPDVDESPLDGEPALDYVQRIARAKAAAVHADAEELVIAADTTVEAGSSILGKPFDDADAASMLRRLSGRTHHVHSGLCVRYRGQELFDVCTTAVTFVPLDDPTIAWYVSTGEPLGKAGSYAIQGAGAVLVSGVSGSVTNVVGLPLHLVIEMARRVGVDLLSPAGG